MQIELTFEGEVFRKVDTTIFGKKPKVASHATTIEEYQEAFNKVELVKARQYAIKRLSLMNLSSKALSSSLRRCLVSEETTERIIDEFISLGYLNDKEWIRGFARQKLSAKYGLRKVLQALSQKGFEKQEIVSAIEGMEDLCEPENEKQAILKLLKTRFRTRDLSIYKEKQKVIASLLRRGFDFALIIDVIKLT